MLDIKELNTKVTTVEWIDPNGKIHPIQIKELLNASEMNDLYNIVLNSVKFANADGKEVYHPQFLEYFWRFAVINAYTDADLPADQTDMCYMLCYSDLWDTVEANTSMNQLSDIYLAIKEQLDADEKRACSAIGFQNILNDVNDIMQALVNFDGLPQWLADKTSDSVKPLTGVNK
ncbi:hypothetical protein [Butyricicoccus intestinisimiae]|uniref:Uncharacterized protein n=1 Tax=Butyricicoccus intestinisimiae TaxID=2841509 RepID=A0ABS6EWT8_9FIRM|nr:hypothetical protein [Butyricicoccus intestinisimiae]MBU5491289.1 hypothetical protein [Butyricicoccus intestinisimiae]